MVLGINGLLDLVISTLLKARKSLLARSTIAPSVWWYSKPNVGPDQRTDLASMLKRNAEAFRHGFLMDGICILPKVYYINFCLEGMLWSSSSYFILGSDSGSVGGPIPITNFASHLLTWAFFLSINPSPHYTLFPFLMGGSSPQCAIGRELYTFYMNTIHSPFPPLYHHILTCFLLCHC